MALVPTISVIPARFRGPSSSSDFNTMNRAAAQDIITAFAAVNTLNDQAALANETLTIENMALMTQVNALATQLSGLTQGMQSLQQLGNPNGTGTAYLPVSLYDIPVNYGGVPSYPQLPASSRATYDPLYGQIIPNIATPAISKCYVVDVLTDQVITPPNVASSSPATVSPTIVPFLIEENDPGQAVDGQETTTWRRNTYFPAGTSISEVQTTLTVTLPQTFINSPVCNYLVIHPYPVFGCDITSVVLHGTATGDQELLTSPIVASGPVRLVFTDTPVVSVDVTFRTATPLYTLKPGLQAFTVGASIVDIGWIGFNQNSSTVLVPFSLGNNYFSTVVGTTPLPTGVTAQLFYQNPSGDVVGMNLGDAPLGFASTLFVELTLTPAQGIIPVVQELALNYVPMYVNA